MREAREYAKFFSREKNLGVYGRGKTKKTRNRKKHAKYKKTQNAKTLLKSIRISNRKQDRKFQNRLPKKKCKNYQNLTEKRTKPKKRVVTAKCRLSYLFASSVKKYAGGPRGRMRVAREYAKFFHGKKYSGIYGCGKTAKRKKNTKSIKQ